MNALLFVSTANKRLFLNYDFLIYFASSFQVQRPLIKQLKDLQLPDIIGLDRKQKKTFLESDNHGE